MFLFIEEFCFHTHIIQARARTETVLHSLEILYVFFLYQSMDDNRGGGRKKANDSYLHTDFFFKREKKIPRLQSIFFIV